MAIIQKRNLVYAYNLPAIDAANGWKTWLDSFSVPFMTTEVTGDANNARFIATFDNKVCIDFLYINSDLVSLTEHFRMYEVGGTPPAPSTWTSMGRNLSAIIAISNTAIFITIDQSSGNRHFACLYENINTQSFYGSLFYDHENTAGIPRQIQDIYLTKYGELSAVYRHTAALNYPTVSGSIDYTDKDLISDGTNSVRDPNYLGCSTVDPHFVYTFSGNNFYALGPNTLVWANNSLSED